MSDHDSIQDLSQLVAPDATPPSIEEFVAWASSDGCPADAHTATGALAIPLIVSRPPDNLPTPHHLATATAYMYTGNCSDLRGSADYWAHCGGATEHGISTANRFRPLKREQLRFKIPSLHR